MFAWGTASIPELSGDLGLGCRCIIAPRSWPVTRQTRGGPVTGRSQHEVTQLLRALRADNHAALDEAPNLLAQADPREAKVIELRFFGGLSEEERSHALGISDRTVRREWEHAKAWLIHQLKRRAPA